MGVACVPRRPTPPKHCFRLPQPLWLRRLCLNQSGSVRGQSVLAGVDTAERPVAGPGVHSGACPVTSTPARVWRALGSVFLVARRSTSQHRHVTGTFPAENKIQTWKV